MSQNRYLPLLAIAALLFVAPHASGAPAKASLKAAKLELQSAGALAFGPPGVLFVADAADAAVVAIDTGDTKPNQAKSFKIENFAARLAARVGTTAKQLRVNDLAVNPISHRAYVSFAVGRGPKAPPGIARIDASGTITPLPFDKIKHAKAKIPDAPGPDAVRGRGRRKRSLRKESITDLHFVRGKLYVAGLSNEEFSSTLRAIPFPFSKVEEGSIVKIFHGAHGKFETHAPVRTFVPFDVEGEPHLIAAYTCTPLVKLPLSTLKPGARVQGTTIAELGNRNRPLDMVTYKKGDKEYLLIANSARGVMKLGTEGIADATPVTKKVPRGEREGIPYDTISDWKGIVQLDLQDTRRALVVREDEGGALTLESRQLP